MIVTTCEQLGLLAKCTSDSKGYYVRKQCPYIPAYQHIVVPTTGGPNQDPIIYGLGRLRHFFYKMTNRDVIVTIESLNRNPII